MFQGFGFLPFAFVAALTVAVGFVFVLAGWGLLLFGPNNTAQRNVPFALYTFTLSFLVQLAGPVVLWQLPYGFAQTHVYGTRMVQVVWSCFLLGNFVLCVASWALAKKTAGLTALLVGIGSKVLLIIWGIGVSWYVFGR